jgi:transposase
MNDKEFFYRVLGLSEPWQVEDVKLDLAGKKVEVRVAVKAGTKWAEDGNLLPIAGYEERRWRHLDTMQLETIITAKVPRVAWIEEDEEEAIKKTTKMVKVPWAEPGSRWTLAFEAFAIQVLLACGSTNEAAEWLRLDWRAVDRIMTRAVERGLARRKLEQMPYLGIDEKSFRKGHRYGSLLNDREKGRVLEVVEHRTTAAAVMALETLPQDVLGAVQAVAMDMSAAYASAVRKTCPQAEIVYDKFHVSALLGQAVDEVRREEHARLLARGDTTLKGTRYDWLFQPDNLSDDRLLSFKELVERDLTTSKAWHHKTLFSEFWNQPCINTAKRFFDQWFKRAVRSKIKPVVAVAQTLQRHLIGLLAYIKHRITNALSESLNSRIQTLKNNARGFHRFDSFRTRILFFLGDLDLQPR